MLLCPNIFIYFDYLVRTYLSLVVTPSEHFPSISIFWLCVFRFFFCFLCCYIYNIMPETFLSSIIIISIAVIIILFTKSFSFSIVSLSLSLSLPLPYIIYIIHRRRYVQKVFRIIHIILPQLYVLLPDENFHISQHH